MNWRILQGDVRETLATLPAQSVQTCVTSPPYWGLRDYGHEGQIGLEPTPDAFVASMVAVFSQVRRVLAEDGTLWLNLGDSYAGGGNYRGITSENTLTAKQSSNRGARGTSQVLGALGKTWDGMKPKDLVGIPWRVAFALQADGWYLRSDIIWSKPNPMPESVTDRPTKAHEYIFLLSKSARYYYDAAAIADASVIGAGTRRTVGPAMKGTDHRKDGNRFVIDSGSRNKRSVWHVATQPFTDWTKTVRRVRVAPGDADGDTKRITSPDCPVHGDLSALVASALYGEHAGDETSRTARTDAGHVRLPHAGSAPIGRNHGEGSPERSSDLLPPSCSGSASESSNRSRRTGRARGTTEPCIASAGTEAGTGGTSASRETGEPSGHTPESRSGRAASGAHLSAETIDRIAHSVSSADSCICELYKETTEEMSHFATYPEKLIEPCILAGSRPGDTVLDPFTGSGTTGAVAIRHQRNFIGCELNPEYVKLAEKRIRAVAPLFSWQSDEPGQSGEIQEALL